ncbi:Rcs stress response system protein RcsF [Motilimonas pumila]|uniref:Exopolysaccharide biosynthesis protein n=1 Tax=Motilimonas pumila TaxID=2303987 RepID=A0A418YEP2_9GAMM|nr:Rcs stress response system protein RcsF [Motilimonas pumila]RJG47626.1 exopolysaccharide biosynthesis protein [Motilimonas pumila]
MRFYPFAALALLTGCSNFSFDSNLDKENFDEYFKPSQVQVYEKEQLEDKQYIHLTTIEGSVCQESERDPVPTLADARTQARIAAAEVGANGIIFKSCIETSDDYCMAASICYGQAIKVAE